MRLRADSAAPGVNAWAKEKNLLNETRFAPDSAPGVNAWAKEKNLENETQSNGA